VLTSTTTVTCEPADVIINILVADDAYTRIYKNALLAMRPGGTFVVAVRTRLLEASEHVPLLKRTGFERATMHWVCGNTAVFSGGKAADAIDFSV
jgi:hypothetical protein